MNFFGRSGIFFIAEMLSKVTRQKKADDGKTPVKRRRPLWQPVFGCGKDSLKGVQDEQEKKTEKEKRHRHGPVFKCGDLGGRRNAL